MYFFMVWVWVSPKTLNKFLHFYLFRQNQSRNKEMLYFKQQLKVSYIISKISYALYIRKILLNEAFRPKNVLGHFTNA